MERLHIIGILLLALSCNLDNIGVGMSYGVRGIKIPLASNLFIAVITGIGTILSMLAGGLISNFLKPCVAGKMGALIITSAGIWILVQEIIRPVRPQNDKQQEMESIKTEHKNVIRRVSVILENPVVADMDFSGHISVSEGLWLGLALTINNLANGIGAGMAGLNPLATTVFVVLFSLITIWLGLNVGHRYASRWLGNLAGTFSGLLLIFIGIYGIF